jgi:hypothetical protein
MLREAPDLSQYDLGEVVYDGHNHPVAVAPAGLAFDDGLGGTLGLPFLLPLLPAIAGAAASALPAITKALPAVTSLISNLGPRSAPAPMPTPPAPTAPAPRPIYVTHAPSFPSAPGLHPGAGIAPGPSGPIVFRRYRRRSAHAR